MEEGGAMEKRGSTEELGGTELHGEKRGLRRKIVPRRKKGFHVGTQRYGVSQSFKAVLFRTFFNLFGL